MFTFHDIHWIAAVLNPRTRMLKMATDSERAHAYSLVRAEAAKIMDKQHEENPTIVNLASSNSETPPRKKFKSYTTQFDDDNDLEGTAENITTSKRVRRELDMYLQMNIINYVSSTEDNDNPLLFWKEQENLLPCMHKLAKQVFSIPASSAAVERSFSSAGVIISQRRSTISPSTVNDIVLIRSAAHYLNTDT